jgi:hypothetical protein
MEAWVSSGELDLGNLIELGFLLAGIGVGASNGLDLISMSCGWQAQLVWLGRSGGLDQSLSKRHV